LVKPLLFRVPKGGRETKNWFSGHITLTVVTNNCEKLCCFLICYLFFMSQPHSTERGVLEIIEERHGFLKNQLPSHLLPSEWFVYGSRTVTFYTGIEGISV
jgi:hypothetical protein